MPPAGIPTYISDPYDKRQLRACDDLVYPVTSKDEHRYSGAYVSVLAGGCSFKIRPTHRSIDDTLTPMKFVKFDNTIYE